MVAVTFARALCGCGAMQGTWRPGQPNTAGGNESATFLDYYYSKLAAFQNFMVKISTVHFPGAYPAVLYPGSSPNVEPANVAAAIATLGQGKMRDIGSCRGDCPDPISAGWARYLLIPSLAQASTRALAWHTGCEQQQASGPVFAAAKVAGLRVGCENSGGIFDGLNGTEYESQVQRFFTWTTKHDTAVTFLITAGSAFFSNMAQFLICEQKELAIADGSSPGLQCLNQYCSHCQGREGDAWTVTKQ